MQSYFFGWGDYPNNVIKISVFKISIQINLYFWIFLSIQIKSTQ